VIRNLAWLIALLVASPAFADEPWEHGVSAQDQAAANALFKEGTALLEQQAHAAAVDKLKAAVSLWDHPAIRLNLAIAEIESDRILEAAADLESALRFDRRPFDPEHYRQALNYQKLLRGRIGEIEVACDQAAAVMLDGKPWFRCPGTQTHKLLAGPHLIVAEAAGYLTIARRLIVSGGATSHDKLSLVPIDSVALVYPSPRWMPWTTLGGGVALALGGAGVWFAGRRQMDRYDSRFADQCRAHGCTDAELAATGLSDLRESAELKGKIATTMMIGGSVLAAAGVVWIVVNRPTRVLPKLEVGPTGDGAAARASWRF
jgi:hypothetical protein